MLMATLAITELLITTAMAMVEILMAMASYRKS